MLPSRSLFWRRFKYVGVANNLKIKINGTGRESFEIFEFAPKVRYWIQILRVKIVKTIGVQAITIMGQRRGKRSSERRNLDSLCEKNMIQCSLCVKIKMYVGSVILMYCISNWEKLGNVCFMHCTKKDKKKAQLVFLSRNCALKEKNILTC